MIFLDDWRPGQGITYGTIDEKTFSHWKRGDVITWNWEKLVHSTFNTGFFDRPLLRIDGLVTEKTTKLIDAACRNIRFSTSFNQNDCKEL